MIENIFSKENLGNSVNNLLTKKDCCGSDGIFISQFKEFWNMNQDKIIKELLSGKYIPGIVEITEILKPNGMPREIANYTCTDKVVQNAIFRAIAPLWNQDFSKYSFAYQQNKSNLDAVQTAASYIEDGNNWVVEIDIENFFDNMNIERLLSKLNKKITDQNLLVLIRRYLYCTVKKEFQKTTRTKGVIQGSALSPLFSNIYLDELDHWLECRYSFCRYADNINLYCKSKAEAEKIYKEVKSILYSKYGLNVNKKKSGIFTSMNRTFLGYEFFIRENQIRKSILENVISDSRIIIQTGILLLYRSGEKIITLLMMEY